MTQRQPGREIDRDVMRCRSSLRGLYIAVQFLTRLPTPDIAQWRPDDLARAAPWFPAVGLVIGVLLAAATAIAGLAAPEIAALAGLLVWVRVTGGLHLDGLADSADGLGAAHGDSARFLTVARDPNTGAFGVVAIVLVLLAKAAALVVIARGDVGMGISLVTWSGLVLIPAWARWTVLWPARSLPALGQGRGAAFADGVGRVAIVGLGGLLAAASVIVAPILAVGCLAPLVAVRFWRTRLGGISGDGHGATIEVVEASLAVALAVHVALGWPAGVSLISWQLGVP